MLSIKDSSILLISECFNNIPVISRRSVLLGEKTGVPGDKHRHVANQLNLYCVYTRTNRSQTHHNCNGDTHS